MGIIVHCVVNILYGWEIVNYNSDERNTVRSLEFVEAAIKFIESHDALHAL